MNITFLLHDPVPDLGSLTRIMERVAQLGYHGIELSACHPLPYPIEAVVALSERLSLPVVSLLSGWSYGHEGLCLSRPDADVRRRAVERLGEYASLAARLKAIVVMGMMQGLRSDEPDEAIANERIAGCLRAAGAAALERGTQIVIEPVNHQQVGFNNTASEVATMVARVESPGVGYMLDTIHMNVEERSIVDAIRTHGSRIRHFHLCESNGGPYGSGNLDFATVLRTLKQTGYRHAVSVKIYRKAGWDEAATQAAEFLGRLGVEFVRR
jgi:sugar phosphate isomerase/epimerase